MNQALIELDARTTDPVDRTGFDIGWDHAHHGLVPPAELLLDGTPVSDGWRAGKAVYGHRTLATGPSTRAWLALRLRAWRLGIAFEHHQLTPHYLAQVQAVRCPVRRVALGGATGQADAPVVDRLNPMAGYAAGNVAMLSLAAAQAREGVDVLEAQRRAHRAQHDADTVLGLDAAGWWRAAALRAFATPMAFHDAARVPLAMLPPNRVRVLNAPQCLQVLVTTQFAAPGWSARTRTLAEMLPAHTLRHDFNLFVGALAPRVLEAAPDGTRRALEDAWLNDRVQRRWQHFVLSLGEPGCQALLQQAEARGLAGVRLMFHAPDQAVDGWSLPVAAPIAAAPRARPAMPQRRAHHAPQERPAI